MTVDVNRLAFQGVTETAHAPEVRITDCAVTLASCVSCSESGAGTVDVGSIVVRPTSGGGDVPKGVKGGHGHGKWLAGGHWTGRHGARERLRRTGEYLHDLVDGLVQGRLGVEDLDDLGSRLAEHKLCWDGDYTAVFCRGEHRGW